MKTINKITLLLLLSCGYCELSFTANTPRHQPVSLASSLTSSKTSPNAATTALRTMSTTQQASDLLRQQPLNFNTNPEVIMPRTNFDIDAFPISKDSMANEILLRKNLINNDTIEAQANRLVQQNYKTNAMKYDILLLMDRTPFMLVNVTTASIENLPLIDEILAQSHEKSIEKRIIINGLKSTLKAINGALADEAYDKQSIFAGEITAELNTMKELIETRLKQVSPVSYLKYYAGAGALAALAATAGVYYYGITAKDTQDYIAGVGKGLVNSASANIGSMVNSTTGAIQSAANSAATAASSSVNTLANSAAQQIGSAINATRESIGSTIVSAGSAIITQKN